MSAPKPDPRIGALVEELLPVRRPPSDFGSLTGWVVASWVTVVGLVLAAGPLREAALTELLTSPRFLVECLLGAALGIVAMAAALQLGVPGRRSLTRAALPACLLAGAFAAAIGYGLLDPPAAPSMAGKRAHCSAETLLFALPSLVLGLWLLRRRAALERIWTAALVALAAASIPALMMQIACMREPLHALGFHLVPAMLLTLATAALGRRFLRRV